MSSATSADAATGPLLRYFSGLTRAALDRLYADGWTCQGLLRALPSMARLYVLRLACAQEDVPVAVVDAWKRADSSTATLRHAQALMVLERLSLIEKSLAPGGGTSWRLHRGFAKQLLDGLCIGGVLDAESERDFGSAALSSGSSGAPVLDQLERHAHSTWERVLQAIIAPPDDDIELTMQCDGATMQELLIEADLLGYAPNDGGTDVDDTGALPARFTMSRQAPRYLLLPTHAQVWRLVRAYMKLSEKGTPGTQHGVLCFLMRLGLLRLGRAYRMDDAALDEAQRATLADMALLGLIYRPEETPELYYATPLCQYLLSTSAGAGAAAASSETDRAGAANGNGAVASGAGSGGEGGGGFLVLETNFRVYAYTGSTLWARVLESFTRLEYVLPNLVIGSLTRDSIHAAVDAGVSAAEIIQFLARNAHPRMAKQTPVLPETVVNQIELWVKEKQRVQYAKARLYQHFSSQAEFLEAEAYANDNKVLIWSKHAPEGMRCLLAVRADAHDAMKRFLKARTQHG